MTNSLVAVNSTGAGGNGGASGSGGPQSSLNPNTFRSSGRAGSAGGGGRGAGILSGGQTATLNLTNVTIAGNITGDGGTGGGGGGGAASSLGGGRGGYGGDGAGIWAQGAHGETAILTHVTIARNFLGGLGLAGSSPNPSNLGPGERGRGAGIATGSPFDPSGAGVYLRRSLIAINGNPGAGDNQCFETYGQGEDIIDQGFSLTWNGTTCPAAVNGDPDLGLLENHGGPTDTLVPQAGSPAIGGVPLGQCSTASDQRGYSRPGTDGASCDIGAVEATDPPAKTPTSTYLTSSAQPSQAGQQVTFTATVSPPPSSEKVGFTDNGTTIPGCGATDLQTGGQFTCTTSFASAGSHSIVATYEGNSLFATSTSTTYFQQVGSPPPVDTTPPETTIDSGPSGTIKSADATFTFHGTAGDTAKVQCSLDTGAFSDCASPKTFSGLADGAHTVSIRAEDAAGNQDNSPAAASFTVDTTVTSPPPPPPPPPGGVAKISKVGVTGPGKANQGSRKTFTVDITNSGTAAATGVKIKVSGGGVNLNASVGQVPAGKKKSVKAKAKLNKAGRNRISFKVTSANAGGKTAIKTVVVKK